MWVISDVSLSADPGNQKSCQSGDARQLVAELLEPPQDPVRKIFAAEGDPRELEVLNRCDAERTYSAMGLACHLFRFDKGRWPKALQELTPSYLPKVPADPWGEGKETFGYALIPGGLPDGSDRPLVFSRCESKGGLFFRVDRPEYGFYDRDGSTLPRRQQKHGGQFRDIAAWAPKRRPPNSPATQPLQLQ